jgi:hypothetical protein
MKKARRLSNEDVSAKFAQGCPQIDIVVICRDYVAVNAVERSVAVTLDIAVKALGGCLLADYWRVIDAVGGMQKWEVKMSVPSGAVVFDESTFTWRPTEEYKEILQRDLQIKLQRMCLA